MKRFYALVSAGLIGLIPLNGPALAESGAPDKVALPRNRPGAHEAAPPEGLLEVPKIPPALGKKPEDNPWIVDLMVHPISNGIWVRLPVVDTDPNRGTTYGIMPVWVIEDPGEKRIEHIHAPSLTYNAIFGWTPTYRYYFYATEDSQLVFRGSFSQFVNREAFIEYTDYDLGDSDFFTTMRFNYYVDGSNRFYGIGPNSPKSGQTNYIQDTLEYYLALGKPIRPGSPWHANLSARVAGQNISNGPINSIPNIDTQFADETPQHRHQDAEGRLFVNYDTRDNPVTTTEGSYLEAFTEKGSRHLASEYRFTRYGVDGRYFKHAGRDGKYVTAGQVRFEQVYGTVPFWLMPMMGGKYTQRAYGDGRYVDRGMLVGTIEERITFFELETAGVKTQFQAAPFVGLGSVFHDSDELAARYQRPVYGTAFRVVAPPQVVGSIDLGVGQEGLAVFMDINYSF